MAKKDDKFTHAAHIKRHTKGTSNEISFSVLDAAKEALDGDRTDLDKQGIFGHISLFTLPGRRKKPVGTPTKEEGLPLSTGEFVSIEGKDASGHLDAFDFAASAMGAARGGKQKEASGKGAIPKALPAPAPAKPVRSPEEEIARRKARRRLSKIMAVAVITVTVMALAGVGGVYLYRDMQHQQSNVSQLDEALNLVNRADETIEPLDVIVSNPFEGEVLAQGEAVQSGLEGAARALDEADIKARAASVELRDPRNKEAANQAVAAIAARRSLLDTGTQLLTSAQAAAQAAEGVEAAWSRVLEADSLARDAAKLVTDTTAENVQASKDKTNEALGIFNEAYTLLSDMQATYTDADLTPLTSYVAKRIESLGFAIASDDAFLAKNKEEAAIQNDAYNAADAEAVALAKSIPSVPSSIVYDAFDQATANLQQSYSTARSQAGTADAFINDYLGTESK